MPEDPHHLRHFDYVGRFQYCLTFCTFERTPLFLTADIMDNVHEQIVRVCIDQAFVVCAYCYMPDHVRFVVEGQLATSDLKHMVARAKQSSGFHFKRQMPHRLWQRYGYERVLRDAQETAMFVRYVVQNPIRAGLVESPSDYPFWGSSQWSREELLDYVRVA